MFSLTLMPKCHLITTEIDRYKPAPVNYQLNWGKAPITQLHVCECQLDLYNYLKSVLDKRNSNGEDYIEVLTSYAAEYIKLPLIIFLLLIPISSYTCAIYITIWISENRPRGSASKSYTTYKDAKRHSRKVQNAAYNEHMKPTSDIDAAAECDERFFCSTLQKGGPYLRGPLKHAA